MPWLMQVGACFSLVGTRCQMSDVVTCCDCTIHIMVGRIEHKRVLPLLLCGETEKFIDLTRKRTGILASRNAAQLTTTNKQHER